MPPTLAAPFVYHNREAENKASENFLNRVENAFGYPVIVKEAHGSLGMQVYLIDNRKDLSAIYDRLKHTPHLYQRFVAESRGLDIRVYVIGGKAAGACERRNDSDFRSSVLYGGKMSVLPHGIGGGVKPTGFLTEYIGLAEKAARLLNLDYCAVDFLKGENGPLLCEINSNAFFNTYVGLGGNDIAAEYVSYIRKRLL